MSAWPGQAGSCKSGTAVSGSHLADDTGPLSKAGYQVVIDDMVLSSDGSSVLTAGQKQSMSLQVDDTVDGFRGFLIRLSGAQGEDVSSSLVISEADDSVKIMPGCETTVAGLTHTGRDVKKSVSSVIAAPCDASQLLLEVTVVRENRGGANDGWYYDSYTIDVDGDCIPEEMPLDDNNTLGDNSTVWNNTDGSEADSSEEGTPTSGANSGRLIVPYIITGILTMFWR